MAAFISKGYETPETIRIAKQYVESAIRSAPGIGHGANR
ncbi:MAG: bifunctional hydroxymethylpyrimidine kinase/phosphomethylpyrimidine kinase [Acidobacteria bacterium]|nr:bifunctional hydroxymethylpyrimidine kinase/phosphomethylpyrimidine kinase [Acidobacteriota bacterium]